VRVTNYCIVLYCISGGKRTGDGNFTPSPVAPVAGIRVKKCHCRLHPWQKMNNRKRVIIVLYYNRCTVIVLSWLLRSKSNLVDARGEIFSCISSSERKSWYGVIIFYYSSDSQSYMQGSFSWHLWESTKCTSMCKENAWEKNRFLNKLTCSWLAFPASENYKENHSNDDYHSQRHAHCSCNNRAVIAWCGCWYLYKPNILITKKFNKVKKPDVDWVCVATQSHVQRCYWED